MSSSGTEGDEPAIDRISLAHEVERLRREIERLQITASQDRGILDALLQHSPHGIIICDASGRLILQNPSSERIWAGSATAGSVAGWGQYKAFHPDGRPYEPEDWTMVRSLRHGVVLESIEYHIERFDGTRGWLLGSAAPLYAKDGQLLGAISIFADITHLKEAEAALRRSEHRFRQILDSVQEMVFTKGRDLAVTFANAATGRFYNRPPEELRGILDLPINQREFTEQYLRDDREVLQTRRPVERLEEPRVSPTGEIRYFHTIKTPIFDPRRDSRGDGSGEILEIVGVSRDITERRRAERRLRANHAVARVLAGADRVSEALPQVIAAIASELQWHAASYWAASSGPGLGLGPGEEGRLRCEALWLSPEHPSPEWIAATSSMRFARGQGLPGRVWESASPHWITDARTEKDFPRAAAARSAGLCSGLAFPILLGSEVLGVIELFARALFNPDAALLEMVLTLGAHIGQFVERARSQEALRREAAQRDFMAKASELFASTLEVNSVLRELAHLAVPTIADFGAVALREPSGVLRYVELVHRDPKKLGLLRELGERYPVPLDATHGAPEVIRSGRTEHAPEISDEQLATNIPDAEALRLLRVLGPRSAVTVPLSARGGVFGALTVVTAESGRALGGGEVGFLEELARRASLAIDNARLYQEAQRAITALERSNKELDQFAYVTSHDLKAPLRGIASLAEWIEEDAGDQLSGDTRRHLELLRGRVRRMEGLIQGILELSRAGRVRVHPESIDVGVLLAEIVDLLQPVPPAQVEIEDGMPRLLTERLPLQQVFSNLISNGLKHAGRADVTIRISAREVEESWEFAVADDGRGIPALYHEKVWDLFQTLEARDRVESTGIGLAIVRKVVEGRGGRAWIDAQSDPSSHPTARGTTFRFTWPKKNTSR